MDSTLEHNQNQKLIKRSPSIGEAADDDDNGVDNDND